MSTNLELVLSVVLVEHSVMKNMSKFYVDQLGLTDYS